MRHRALLRTLPFIAVALCGLLAGYLVYRRLHPQPSIAALPVAAPASRDGDGAPDAEAPGETGHHVVPETVPDVQLPDLSGRPRSLRAFLGHPLIINFWATWCEPCRREMPLLARLRTQYHAQGLEIVGVAVDFPNAVQQYLRKNPVPYPLLAGETQGLTAIESFGMQPALPFSVFADGRGNILVVKLGELHADEAEAILQALQEEASGRETLAAARTAIAERLHALAITRAKAVTQITPRSLHYAASFGKN
jgi:thiol-disulfide isomerase/thioredoxin